MQKKNDRKKTQQNPLNKILYVQDVPDEKECPNCNGSGYDPWDGGQCEKCAGTGTISRETSYY